MAKRSMKQRLSESSHLNIRDGSGRNATRNKKRTKLLGKRRVAEQNTAAFRAPTDSASAAGAVSRVGEYKRAAKKQFNPVGKLKKEKY